MNGSGESAPAYLPEMSWPDIEQALVRGAGVGLVVGSLEQHGPHLPTATDVYIPLAVLNAVAARVDMTVAAPFFYGYRSMPQTGGGEFFPGTLFLTGPTLERAVEEVVGQLLETGFRRALVLSWHWENMRVLWEALVEARAKSDREDAKLVLIDNPGQLIQQATIDAAFGADFKGWDVEHAALAETALMQYLHPQLVRQDRIADDEATEIVPYEVIPAPRERAPGSGVFAQASLATVEKGRMLFDSLVDAVEEIARKELGLPPR